MVEDIPVASEKRQLLQMCRGHVERVEIVEPASSTVFHVELDGQHSSVRGDRECLVEDAPLMLGRLDIFPKFSILFQERRRNVSFYT